MDVQTSKIKVSVTPVAGRRCLRDEAPHEFLVVAVCAVADVAQLPGYTSICPCLSNQPGPHRFPIEWIWMRQFVT